VTSSGWIDSPPHRLFFRRAQPAGTPIAQLLIVHGYGDHSGRYAHVMDWFARHGVGTFGFDFRGHGRSSGKRGYVARWSEFQDDLRAVLRSAAFARTPDAPQVPIFLLGHSHGGLVAAAAGLGGMLTSAGIAGVVLSAPYLRPKEALSPLWRFIAAATNVLTPSLSVGNGLEQGMMTSDPEMIEDSKQDRLLLRSATPRWYTSTLRTQHQVMEQASRFSLPMLCLIGDADPIADPDAAQQFTDRARASDKSCVLLPGQRHEILRELERESTFQTILDWIAARIDVPARGR